jgi:micrococcal nuclease
MLTDNLYFYRAALGEVTDGDTIKVTIDMGQRVKRDIVLRFENINAPEMHGNTKAAGQTSKDAAAAWLANRHLVVRTYKDPGSYDRYTAEVFDAFTEEAFTQYMLTKGFAEEYHYKWA